MPSALRRLAERAMRADLLLVSYPRSGNTWLRFVLGALKTGNPQDFASINRVVPDLHQAPLGVLRDLNSPRIIKSHYPVTRQIRFRRALYIVRDPGAVAASYLRFLTMVGRVLQGPIDDDAFARRFVEGQLGDGFGPWLEHVRGWTREAARNPRVAVIRYEDLIDDPEGTLGRALDGLQLGPWRSTVRQALGWSSRDRLQELEAQQPGQLWGTESARVDVPFVGDPDRPHAVSLRPEVQQWIRDELLGGSGHRE